MPTLKIHLERDELAPVERLATELKVSIEDIGYAALDLLMRHAAEESTIAVIRKDKSALRTGLPAWADSPREIHAYESMT